MSNDAEYHRAISVFAITETGEPEADELADFEAMNVELRHGAEEHFGQIVHLQYGHNEMNLAVAGNHHVDRSGDIAHVYERIICDDSRFYRDAS